MAILDSPRDPSPTELKTFGLIVLAVFTILGSVVRWRAGAPGMAWLLWSAGAMLAAVYYAVPPLRRPLFFAWMRLFQPIGWVVSHLLLVSIFYLVLAPIGLLLRAFGRDAMHRELKPDAATYWILRRGERRPQDYFRQF